MATNAVYLDAVLFNLFTKMKNGDTLSIPKTPTGVAGLDEITHGGFPKGRPVLICGNAGCGKTLLAAQFIVNGIVQYGEPGLIMSFEETADDLTTNVRSLGFD